MMDEKRRSSLIILAAAECETAHESELLEASLVTARAWQRPHAVAQGSRVTGEQFCKFCPTNESSELLCFVFFPWLSNLAFPLDFVD